MSYTAWDGKTYEGDPPEGWHLANDQRWWSPGTGPTPEVAAASPAPLVAVSPVAEPSPPLEQAANDLPSVSGLLDTRRTDVPAFHFDGGAGSYLGTGILAALITVFTLGIAFPFAYVLRLRWRAKHTFIEGRRLMFTGTGMGLFGNWIKWLLLIVVTLGIYSFWVQPRLVKWAVERQAFDPRG